MYECKRGGEKYLSTKKKRIKKISTFIHNLLLQINYQSKINSWCPMKTTTWPNKNLLITEEGRYVDNTVFQQQQQQQKS